MEEFIASTEERNEQIRNLLNPSELHAWPNVASYSTHSGRRIYTSAMKNVGPFAAVIGLSFLAFAISVLASALFGHIWKFAITLPGYCFLAYQAANWQAQAKMKYWVLICILLAPPTIFELPIHLAYFHDTEVSFLSFLSFYLGAALGLVIHARNRVLKIGGIACMSVMTVGIFVFYPEWIHFCNYGTFSGRVLEKVPEFVFEEENGTIITNEQLRGKTVLLDFWSTHCSACLDAFPELQKRFDTPFDRSKYQVLSVNGPISSDSASQAYAEIRALGYHFPVVKADEDMVKRFKIGGYPTVIVIENGQIVYRGNMAKAPKSN